MNNTVESVTQMSAFVSCQQETKCTIEVETKNKIHCLTRQIVGLMFTTGLSLKYTHNKKRNAQHHLVITCTPLMLINILFTLYKQENKIPTKAEI